MGTRSLLYISGEDEGKEVILCCIFKQFDGYPQGLGKTLYDFLSDKTVVTGFTSEQQEQGSAFNGSGCMAASIIAHLKDGIGNVYITPIKKLTPKRAADAWAEWVYQVYVSGENQINIRVYEVEGSSRVKLVQRYDGAVSGMAEVFGFQPPVEELPQELAQEQQIQ